MKILFVCLGNICRSPLAEGIARDIIKQKSLDIDVDSAGPDPYFFNGFEGFEDVFDMIKISVDNLIKSLKQ
jgi:protein-tyrosine-phosphatase